MKQLTRVALALGGNLGPRLETLQRAAARLADEFLQNSESSRVYETAPWGISNQPAFLNAVLIGDSEWKPPAILNYVKALEREMGREHGPRNGPRLLDIDLLAYAEEIWESDGIAVPHPRLHEREFVLLPLVDVWPKWLHPRLALTAESLLSRLPQETVGSASVFAQSLLPAKQGQN